MSMDCVYCKHFLIRMRLVANSSFVRPPCWLSLEPGAETPTPPSENHPFFIAWYLKCHAGKKLCVLGFSLLSGLGLVDSGSQGGMLCWQQSAAVGWFLCTVWPAVEGPVEGCVSLGCPPHVPYHVKPPRGLSLRRTDSSGNEAHEVLLSAPCSEMLQMNPLTVHVCPPSPTPADAAPFKR